MVFLAGRDRYTQRTLLRAIHERLTNQGGCENVRYRPSSRRPRFVIADIDTAAFLGHAYQVDHARLELRFWYPVGVNFEYYRLNWVESSRSMTVGFHQDADHPDLGRCHIQLNFEDTPVDRHPTTFLDAHPLAVLDTRLQELPTVLAAIRWEDGQPSLPTRPV